MAENLTSRLLEKAEKAEREIRKDKDADQQYVFQLLKDLDLGIKNLEKKLSDKESSGALKTTDDESALIDLQRKYHDLKALQRGDKMEASARSKLFGDERAARFAVAVEHPDPDSLENQQVLLLQQRLMNDQDQNLDSLSIAIGRQRELGLLIGDELEVHAELIDETDELVGRTDRRLQEAQKKLRHVGRKVKDNRSICIVIALIIVFFVLVALFR